MAETTGIEWCDATFNPWIGCTRVSPACDSCYAARSTPARTLGVSWGAGEQRRRTSETNWREPLRWNRKAGVNRERWRVFCASLADVFDNEVPQEWRDDLFALIAATPNLEWLVLTKRVGNVRNMVPPAWFERWPANVWLGSTVVNQEEADRDIPKLLAVPAIVRFLSIEPMLGPMNLDRWLLQCCGNPQPGNDHGVYGREPDHCCGQPEPRDGIDWVIAGGESGPHARPVHPDWLRSLRDQCASAGVRFLLKQWGEWVSVSEVAGEGPHHTFPDGATVRRIGKKAAGRTLDGVVHDGYPAEAR